ncbi:MAG: hypothetical protein ABEJ56_05795 [Candidatus Nanohaloarchaea archaeon]
MKLSDFLDIDRRSQVLYFLSVLIPSFSLAAVYIYGNGPKLAQMQAYSKFDPLLFVSGALIGAAGLSAVAWYFTEKPSVAVAPIIGNIVGLYGGLEDVAVYLFCSIRSTGRCQGVFGLPDKLPWLNDAGIGVISESLGFSAVTDTALVVSTALTITAGYLVLVAADLKVFNK